MATAAGNRIDLTYNIDNGSLDITPKQWQQICNGCEKICITSSEKGEIRTFQVEFVNAQKSILKLFEPCVLAEGNTHFSAQMLCNNELFELGTIDEDDSCTSFSSRKAQVVRKSIELQLLDENSSISEIFDFSQVAVSTNELPSPLELRVRAKSKLTVKVGEFNQNYKCVSLKVKTYGIALSLQEYAEFHVLSTEIGNKRAESNFLKVMSKLLKDRNVEVTFFDNLISVEHLNRTYNGDSLLGLAIRFKRYDVLRVFISKKPNLSLEYQSPELKIKAAINDTPTNRTNALREAVYLGDTQAVELLIEPAIQVELNQVVANRPPRHQRYSEKKWPSDLVNYTVMHYAMMGFRDAKDKSNHAKIFTMLLPYRNELLLNAVHHPDIDNPLNLLSLSVADNRQSTYEFLKEHGPKPEYTPLIQLMLNRQFSITEENKGIPEEILILDLCKYEKENPVTISLFRTLCRDTPHLDIDFFNKEHRTALQEAIRRGKNTFAEELMDNGASINICYERGKQLMLGELDFTPRAEAHLSAWECIVMGNYDTGDWEKRYYIQEVSWAKILAYTSASRDIRGLRFKGKPSKNDIAQVMFIACVEQKGASLELVGQIMSHRDYEHMTFDVNLFDIELNRAYSLEKLSFIQYLIINGKKLNANKILEKLLQGVDLKERTGVTGVLKHFEVSDKTTQGATVLHLCCICKNIIALQLLVQYRAVEIQAMLSSCVGYEGHRCLKRQSEQLTAMDIVEEKLKYYENNSCLFKIKQLLEGLSKQVEMKS